MILTQKERKKKYCLDRKKKYSLDWEKTERWLGRYGKDNLDREKTTQIRKRQTDRQGKDSLDSIAQINRKRPLEQIDRYRKKDS